MKSVRALGRVSSQLVKPSNLSGVISLWESQPSNLKRRSVHLIVRLKIPAWGGWIRFVCPSQERCRLLGRPISCACSHKVATRSRRSPLYLFWGSHALLTLTNELVKPGTLRMNPMLVVEACIRSRIAGNRPWDRRVYYEPGVSWFQYITF